MIQEITVIVVTVSLFSLAIFYIGYAFGTISNSKEINAIREEIERLKKYVK